MKEDKEDKGKKKEGDADGVEASYNALIASLNDPSYVANLASRLGLNVSRANSNSRQLREGEEEDELTPPELPEIDMDADSTRDIVKKFTDTLKAYESYTKKLVKRREKEMQTKFEENARQMAAVQFRNKVIAFAKKHPDVMNYATEIDKLLVLGKSLEEAYDEVTKDKHPPEKKKPAKGDDETSSKDEVSSIRTEDEDEEIDKLKPKKTDLRTTIGRNLDTLLKERKDTGVKNEKEEDVV